MGSLHGRSAIDSLLLPMAQCGRVSVSPLGRASGLHPVFRTLLAPSRIASGRTLGSIAAAQSYGIVLVPQRRSLRWFHEDAHHLPTRSNPFGVVSKGTFQDRAGFVAGTVGND